jgi:hypothetical protein
MAYRFHGRAAVDPANPAAWGTCDRCGFNYNLKNLAWQFDWAGTVMINKGLLVCDHCLDAPSPWSRTIVLPPDPQPIINARPEPYLVDETDWRVVEDQSAFRILEDGSATRVPENDATQAVDESTN